MVQNKCLTLCSAIKRKHIRFEIDTKTKHYSLDLLIQTLRAYK